MSQLIEKYQNETNKMSLTKRRALCKYSRIEPKIQSSMADENSLSLLRNSELQTQQLQKRQCEMCIQYFLQSNKINKQFTIIPVLHFCKDLNMTKIQSRIYNNNILFRIQCRAMKNLLCRYLNKLNSIQRQGCFVLDVINGDLIYKRSIIYSRNQFIKINLYPDANVQAERRTAIEVVTCNILKILRLVDLHEDTCYQPIENIQFDISVLKQYLMISTIQFQFMYEMGFRNLLPSQSIRILQNATQKYNKLVFNCSGFQETRTFPRQIKSYEQINQELSIKQIALKKYFQFPSTQVNIMPKVQTYQELGHRQIVAVGGFGKIEKVKLEMSLLLSSEVGPKFQQTVAIKTQKSTNNPKIPHEKRILMTMKDQPCVFIARYYYSQQLMYTSNLLMKYYPNKSLDSYKRNHLQYLSLISRIHLLCNLTQSLRFLRTHRIVHFDLKPHNMIIQKQLILKLIDFGSAFSGKFYDDNFRPGYSIPYVAPQTLKSEYEYNQKTDVFSLGVIMHQMLFDCLPKSFRKILSNKLIRHYKYGIQDFNSKILTSPQSTKYSGPFSIMNILGELCLQCLQEDHHKRPLLDWILIILRQSLEYVQKMY